MGLLRSEHACQSKDQRSHQAEHLLHKLLHGSHATAMCHCETSQGMRQGRRSYRAEELAHEVAHGAVVLVQVGGEVGDRHGGPEEGLRGRQVVVAQWHAVLQQLHHLQLDFDAEAGHAEAGLAAVLQGLEWSIAGRHHATGVVDVAAQH